MLERNKVTLGGGAELYHIDVSWSAWLGSGQLCAIVCAAYKAVVVCCLIKVSITTLA